MRRLSLEDIKRIQLEIMDDVHSFCVSRGIRYSLAGGSLLGAVKHKGFVPMDDDIDIMLPRPDYERFIKEYVSDKNFVLDLSESDSCREQFAKVCRKGTRLVDPLLGRTSFLVFIDVCPIDGAPSDEESFYRRVRKRLDLVPKVCAFYKEVPDHKFRWFVKYVLKRLLSGYPYGCVHLKRDIDTYLKQNDFESSPFASELLVINDRLQILPSSIFKEFVLSEFEGRHYCILAKYDEYLTQKYRRYGDYKNLPLLNAPVHDYEAYEVDCK